MIVIDASVATKLINSQEEGSTQAINLLTAHIDKKEKIIVPALLFIEVANALATKTHLKELYIKKGISLLFAADFVVHDVLEKDLLEASTLAKKYQTSVYDMIYAVIAKNKKIILVTSDNKFITKVKFPFVKLLS